MANRQLRTHVVRRPFAFLIWQSALWLTIPALVAFLGGCAGTVASTAPSVAPAPSLVEVKRQVSAYIDSGRYEAEIATVAEGARAYLESRVRRGGKLAIVLDIDETTFQMIIVVNCQRVLISLAVPTTAVSP